MAPYSYSRDFTPPAPVITITVSSPGSPFGLPLPALVDSGAFMTVLPAQVVQNLRLRQVGLTPRRGAFDDELTQSPVFAVELATEFAPPEIVRVIVFERSYALLGRDLLNRWKLTLNGPQGLLEIIV